MDDKLEKIADTLVKNFIKEMNGWELFCNEIDKSDLHYLEIDKKQKEYVKNIFDKYCTQKDRKYGRPNCISYGVDGTFIYNETEKIIKIEQANKNRMLVYTQNEDDKFMYIILKKNNNWLIDSKKVYGRKVNDKWDNTYL
ncbi:MAG: RhsIA family immunity protein [Campylobacteraceae bacterium]|jgi:hypothetical protein|nr:RhsIA family immunity protein [Campylobacteraceae bacterium]